MTKPPKIWDVLCDSKRIIYTKPLHYLTLSLIFLLRLSLSSSYFSNSLSSTFYNNNNNIFSLSILINSIFTNGAFFSVTYIVYHSYFNQPIRLKQAIKSISTSFLPLLATDIIFFTIGFIGSFLFAFIGLVISFLLAYLGGVDLQTHSYLAVVLSMPFVLPPVMYLIINLSLVKVIVVVESVKGFEPWRRSWKLVKGMKMLILLIICLFASLQWILEWVSDQSWVLKLVISPILIMLSIYDIVVITVLYIYRKEKHGESLLMSSNLEKKRTA